MEQLYIFDYDGVIVDSLDTWIEVVDRIGERYGFDYRMTHDNVNQLEYVTMDGILEKSGKNRNNSGDYLSDIYEEMAARSSIVPFFKGIDRIFKKLCASGHILCVNTANDSCLVKSRLQDEGLLDYITDVTGGDIPGSKSEKIIYLIKKYGFTSESCWMIGDTRGDVIEGKKAGVKTAAVTYGWHNYENMKDTEPDCIFRTIEELENFFSVKTCL